MNNREILDEMALSLNQCQAGISILLDYMEDWSGYQIKYNKKPSEENRFKLIWDVSRSIENMLVVAYAINSKISDIEDDVNDLATSMNIKKAQERQIQGQGY